MTLDSTFHTLGQFPRRAVPHRTQVVSSSVDSGHDIGGAPHRNITAGPVVILSDEGCGKIKSGNYSNTLIRSTWKETF
ncbi:MAG: hypothetical protein HY033_13495 [Ignavibacteriae bacterium]|nr:hypothetical protein [Ignavibacteria bacterium]MBI3365906.1 hypothetical protein [Ignavibacteriota bacterium]